MKRPAVALAEQPTFPPPKGDAPQSPDSPALATCLDDHMARVSESSAALRQFVDRAFADDLRQALPVTALEVVNAACASGWAELRPYTRDRVRYVVCDFEEQPWVSLSIVPQEGRDPRIDLLSYGFLTDTERREIEPQIDPEISRSGLA